MYPNIEQQSSTMQSGGKQQTLEGGGGENPGKEIGWGRIYSST